MTTAYGYLCERLSDIWHLSKNIQVLLAAEYNSPYPATGGYRDNLTQFIIEKLEEDTPECPYRTNKPLFHSTIISYFEITGIASDVLRARSPAYNLHVAIATRDRECILKNLEVFFNQKPTSYLDFGTQRRKESLYFGKSKWDWLIYLDMLFRTRLRLGTKPFERKMLDDPTWLDSIAREYCPQLAFNIKYGYYLTDFTVYNNTWEIPNL